MSYGAVRYISPRIMNLPAKITKAFTLIELLIVIAVVAILVVLLAPTIRVAHINTINDQATYNLQNIVVAVKAYQTDYGKYPIDETVGGTAGDVTFGDVSKGYGASKDNAQLFDVLRNNVTGTNKTLVKSLNPNQTVYIEASLCKVIPPKKGIDPNTGGFYDPWGAEYYIMIDGNNDHHLTPPSGLPGLSTNANSTKPLSAKVIAWSLGKKQKNTIKTW